MASGERGGGAVSDIWRDGTAPDMGHPFLRSTQDLQRDEFHIVNLSFTRL
jgi:hypothetical protein